MLNYLKEHVNKNKYVNKLIDIYFEVKKIHTINIII